MEQDFLEMSPENQYRELWAEYMGTRPGNEELLQWMEREGFFEAPASAKHHGNFPGGLCQHSINVAMEALDLCATPAFKGVPPPSCTISAKLGSTGLAATASITIRITGRWATVQRA